MNWIVTCDGHEASLEFPTHADYEIERIAHSLAQINRFNGHAARPYSVAEHSLLVLDIAKTKLGLDAHGQMAGGQVDLRAFGKHAFPLGAGLVEQVLNLGLQFGFGVAVILENQMTL